MSHRLPSGLSIFLESASKSSGSSPPPAAPAYVYVSGALLKLCRYPFGTCPDGSNFSGANPNRASIQSLVPADPRAGINSALIMKAISVRGRPGMLGTPFG